MTTNKEAVAAIAAGFKNGGKTGYAMPEQVASIRYILKDVCQLDDSDVDKAVGLIKESGLLNASATRQALVSMGLIKAKTVIDPTLLASFE